MPRLNDGSGGWYLDVLRGIKAPATYDNDVVLQMWAQSEGMPDYASNWLATTKTGFGGSAFNSAGVFVYPTYAAGVKATVATLLQPNMRHIVTALRDKKDLVHCWQAINRSPWCKGCQSGNYPISLKSYIESAGAAALKEIGQTVISTIKNDLTGPGGALSIFTLSGQPPPWDWSGIIRGTAANIDGGASVRDGLVKSIRAL